MKAAKKIGILGGTFDPVHRIHLELATEAREQFGLEEVWLMPSGDPPHKSGMSITPGEERLYMLQLAIEGRPGLLASDYELRRTGKIYTAETLKRLSKEYPDVSWYFILGGDSLLYLDQWYHPEEILAYAVILAAIRGCKEDSTLQTELFKKRQQLFKQFPGADIRWIFRQADNLSSSLLRELFSKQKRTAQEEHLLQEALPVPVYQYITKHLLYQADKRRTQEPDEA